MRSKFFKLSLSLAASAVLATAVTQAQVPPDRFVQDPFGKAVRDPFGKCVLAIGGQPLAECLAPLAKGEPPPAAPTRETLTLGADAYFDFDKATLKPAGRERLDTLARDLRQLGDVSGVSVVGHTDAIGTDAYNQALSQRRAQAVVDYLVRQGVNPGVISASGEGERMPVASNESAAGRAQNRRVEVTVEAGQALPRR